MRILGGIAACLCLAGVALAAPAKPAPRPPRATVEARLQAQDMPPTAEELAALGRGVDLTLIEVASDEKADILLRARAVSALAYTPSSASRRYLEKLTSHPETTDAGRKLLLRKAILALGWIGGPGVPERLGPLLTHADADVRIDTALGLGLTRLPRAADLLRARLPAETDPRVRSHVGRQLRVIEAALTAGAEPAR